MIRTGSSWHRTLRAIGAVAFAYALLLQFALSPVAMMRMSADPAAAQAMALCVGDHEPGTGDPATAGHDCVDCCLIRVVTEPALLPPVSQPVVAPPAPRVEGRGWHVADVRGPPREAWSDHKSQRGPPARA